MNKHSSSLKISNPGARPSSASPSAALKAALFATGLSGIVAEYILSTLASYFLGDSITQWTLTVSVMLFAMGLGSGLSRFIRFYLLDAFLVIELVLSMLAAFSALLVYASSAFSPYTGILIYTLSIAIGMLIGMEIPLVTRMNEEYQSLRVNIAGVLERDYFGSLIGGLFFAFVGLPYLGMAYTPFILGSLNFAVAVWLYFRLKDRVPMRNGRTLPAGGLISGLLLIAGLSQAEPILLHSEQRHFKDKVVLQKQSRYQRIVMTEWKGHHWLYLNRNLQLSTIDEFLYHEPLVHPVMQLTPAPERVLVLGGGDGCAAREILKHPSVKSITVVDLDPVMTSLARKHPVFLAFNDSAFLHPKVEVINEDAFGFLKKASSQYDVIIADLPDPKGVDLNRLYTLDFYQRCYDLLARDGHFITQAGSPYYATRAFRCIDTTVQAAGFASLRMHNQVLSMGEWGWIIGSKSLPPPLLKQRSRQLQFQDIPTRWLNHEAMGQMSRFGKLWNDQQPVEINTIQQPKLYRYYLQGNWDLY